MKASFSGSLLVLVLALGTGVLQADDTNAAPAPAAPASQRASYFKFLNPADRDKFLATEKKALDENPDLKAELSTLIAERKTMGTQPTPEFIQKMTVHRAKIRAVMIKDDPSLAPIFDQIDQYWASTRAKGNGQTAPSTNASSSTPTKP